MSKKESHLAKTVRNILARTAGPVFLANAVSQLIFLTAMAIIARKVGPELFGIYSFGLALSFVLGVLAALGMDQTLVREMTKAPTREQQLWVSAFIMRLISCCVFGSCTFIALRLLSNDSQERVILELLCFYVVVFSMTMFAENYYRVRMRMRVPAVAKVVGRLLLLTSLLILFWLHYGINAVCMATILSELGPLLVVIAMSVREFHPSVSFDRAVYKSIIVQSWPIALMSLSVVVYVRIDMLMLSVMSSFANVGNYAVAVRLSDPLSGISLAMQVAMLPLLSKSLEHGARTEMIEECYSKMSEWLLMFLLPISVLMTLFAPQVVHLIYGTRYSQAPAALQILVWAQLFASAGVFYSTALIAESRQLLAALAAVLMAVINVVLNVILIPKLGIVGAAYSTLLSYAAGPVVILVYRETRVYMSLFIRSMAIPIAGCIVMLVAAALLRSNWMISASSGLVLYLATVVFLHTKWRRDPALRIERASV